MFIFNFNVLDFINIIYLFLLINHVLLFKKKTVSVSREIPKYKNKKKYSIILSTYVYV